MHYALLHLAPFAALLGLMQIWLTVLTVRRRKTARQALGTGQNEALTRAIRAHGNFTEQATFGLVMILLVALLGGSGLLVTLLCLLLVLGRIAHAYSILIVEPRDGRYRFRAIGMVLGFTAVGVSAAFLLWQWLALYL